MFHLTPHSDSVNEEIKTSVSIEVISQTMCVTGWKWPTWHCKMPACTRARDSTCSVDNWPLVSWLSDEVCPLNNLEAITSYAYSIFTHSKIELSIRSENRRQKTGAKVFQKTDSEYLSCVGIINYHFIANLLPTECAKIDLSYETCRF